MNPLTWSREHRAALAVAAAAGALLGLAVALAVVSGAGRLRWAPLWCGGGPYDRGCTYLVNGYWLAVAGWVLVGALAGAAAAYVRRLLR